MHACVGKLNGIWCWQKDLLIFRENIRWCMNGTVKEIKVSSEEKKSGYLYCIQIGRKF